MSVNHLSLKLRRIALLLDDKGIVESLSKIMLPNVLFFKQMVVKGKYQDLADWKTNLPSKYIGKVSDLVTDKSDDELVKSLEKYYYIVSFEWLSGEYLNDCFYDNDKGTIEFHYNIALPLRSLNEFPDQKTKMLRDISRYDSSIRHEVTHLLRDIQTGHITKIMDRMVKDKELRRIYETRGHTDMEFEIDAAINGLAQLKKRIGDERYNKLTRQRLKELSVMIRFPEDKNQQHVWIKRLIRENLLPAAWMDEIHRT